MKRIVTVQDLINELMLVVNKKAEINVTVAGDGYETEYTPCLYDFSIIDFTDVHPDDGEAEPRSARHRAPPSPDAAVGVLNGEG